MSKTVPSMAVISLYCIFTSEMQAGNMREDKKESFLSPRKSARGLFGCERRSFLAEKEAVW